jgi:hypothetical protein
MRTFFVVESKANPYLKAHEKLWTKEKDSLQFGSENVKNKFYSFLFEFGF